MLPRAVRPRCRACAQRPSVFGERLSRGDSSRVCLGHLSDGNKSEIVEATFCPIACFWVFQGSQVSGITFDMSSSHALVEVRIGSQIVGCVP